MPIERARYPKDWELISRRVKNKAGWGCQHCYEPCLLPGEDWLDFLIRGDWTVGEALEVWERPARFVLTTAHLDQNPGNNDPSNLKALCSVCHLQHDRPFRTYNSYLKRERRGQLNLFDLVPPQLAGHGRDSTRIQLPMREEVEQ